MRSSVYYWWGSLLAGVVLLGGGVGYRVTAAAINAELEAPIRLDPPLSSLPLVIGPWQGEDVPISEGVQKIAKNDDYVNRRYRNRGTGEVVNLYIGYTARPRTMLGHRPTVCYPSAGWSHLGTRTLEVPLEGTPAAGTATATPARGALRVLAHTFVKPGAPSDARVIVLNYYVLNGVPTVDENSFWGFRWRDPNIGGDASRYVAQAQMSVSATAGDDAAERVLRQFATDSVAAILLLLPAADLLRADHQGESIGTDPKRAVTGRPQYGTVGRTPIVVLAAGVGLPPASEG